MCLRAKLCTTIVTPCYLNKPDGLKLVKFLGALTLHFMMTDAVYSVDISLRNKYIAENEHCITDASHFVKLI